MAMGFKRTLIPPAELCQLSTCQYSAVSIASTTAVGVMETPPIACFAFVNPGLMPTCQRKIPVQYSYGNILVLVPCLSKRSIGHQKNSDSFDFNVLDKKVEARLSKIHTYLASLLI